LLLVAKGGQLAVRMRDMRMLWKTRRFAGGLKLNEMCQDKRSTVDS